MQNSVFTLPNAGNPYHVRQSPKFQKGRAFLKNQSYSWMKLIGPKGATALVLTLTAFDRTIAAEPEPGPISNSSGFYAMSWDMPWTPRLALTDVATVQDPAALVVEKLNGLILPTPVNANGSFYRSRGPTVSGFEQEVAISGDNRVFKLLGVRIWQPTLSGSEAGRPSRIKDSKHTRNSRTTVTRIAGDITNPNKIGATYGFSFPRGFEITNPQIGTTSVFPSLVPDAQYPNDALVTGLVVMNQAKLNASNRAQLPRDGSSLTSYTVLRPTIDGRSASSGLRTWAAGRFVQLTSNAALSKSDWAIVEIRRLNGEGNESAHFQVFTYSPSTGKSEELRRFVHTLANQTGFLRSTDRQSREAAQKVLLETFSFRDTDSALAKLEKLGVENSFAKFEQYQKDHPQIFSEPYQNKIELIDQFIARQSARPAREVRKVTKRGLEELSEKIKNWSVFSLERALNELANSGLKDFESEWLKFMDDLEKSSVQAANGELAPSKSTPAGLHLRKSDEFKVALPKAIQGSDYFEIGVNPESPGELRLEILGLDFDEQDLSREIFSIPIRISEGRGSFGEPSFAIGSGILGKRVYPSRNSGNAPDGFMGPADIATPKDPPSRDVRIPRLAPKHLEEVRMSGDGTKAQLFRKIIAGVTTTSELYILWQKNRERLVQLNNDLTENFEAKTQGIAAAIAAAEAAIAVIEERAIELVSAKGVARRLLIRGNGNDLEKITLGRIGQSRMNCSQVADKN